MKDKNKLSNGFSILDLGDKFYDLIPKLDIVSGKYTGTMHSRDKDLINLHAYLLNSEVLIPVTGGIGNNLFIIAFGRWLRTFGVSVTFVDRTVHGSQTLDFIKDKTGETLYDNKKFNLGKLAFTHLNEPYYVLRQCLIDGKQTLACWYPKLRCFMQWDPIALKDEIAINIRRGDFLKPNIKNKKPCFTDLCETKYYANVAKKCKELNLPVRIISDEPDTIPKSITRLFPSAEVTHGTFEEDFYKFAECRYKFISNSTFVCWASYATPDATVFYPKGTIDNLVLDKWIGIDIA